MGRGNEEEYLLGEKAVAEEPSEGLLIHLSQSLSIESLQMVILRKVFQVSGPLPGILGSVSGCHSLPVSNTG